MHKDKSVRISPYDHDRFKEIAYRKKHKLRALFTIVLDHYEELLKQNKKER